ncbi:DNA cross-link repair 1A protein SNM1-like protein A [Larimichthys crocea]|uniref:DNA cross-link repair 1A protein n=1 Tax=Larimichthys crocea TaxID=215358 RepID=A0A6G0HXQ5_LARCR|nr:DNA cross-link repair 1A protein SNM1-like protein A [Larimichthys crocea]
MSQKDECEDDIWEYKPLEKKRKSQESPTVRRCTTRKPPRRRDTSVKSSNRKVKTGGGGDCSSSSATASESPPTNDTVQDGSSSGDHCPICQMPFSILVVQTQRWHVAECLDTPRDTCKECPDGLQCSSTIPNHYKKFNHTLLAHSRANGDSVLLSQSQRAETSGETGISYLPGQINNEADGSILESSQDSVLSLSAVSIRSASPHSDHTPTKPTNGLLFLRSPGPEDFKKKKGWSSSTKNKKSLSSSQESRTELSSSPMKAESVTQACEDLPKNEPSPDYDDAISYSPLSEFPAETEVTISESRKALFNHDASENEDEDSMVLFSDGFSSEDELLSEFIDNMDTNNVQVKNTASLNTQLDPVTSLPPTNQPGASKVVKDSSDSTGGKEAQISPCKSSIKSPQSIVLERLRETLLSSDSLCLKNLNESEQPHTTPQVPSSQTSVIQRSQTMPPQKGQSKTGQASCLKQTDIGVFFGLKPLKEKEKEKEAESGPNDLNALSTPTLGENSGQKRPRRERQRRNKADKTADTSQGEPAVDNSNVVAVQGETKRGRNTFRNRGWRRSRWNRVNADGEVELPRCPFYKKIPGTKFVVDAFQYGEIEGITAYFLTHFHSDHYGGLTKNSTVPIYCNRITGNLVKSKLKVAEQYVHILPMNTQVTVEGVRVILLDANHCPGSAMLLFSLPDGQTVLHTGDFRADPSMETYPELLRCRVQTLYLDTTYCSPEYTFPRQQEVINFAASTAFELVTLNPRTLVVCGSYSVGKEKVFLALAEVLGSKVCLSRDKYNTMCCLESEQVRQRITTDWKAAQVHVLPMMQLSFKKLQDYLARFSRQYDQLVAFKPTGWTFSQQVDSVEDIQPEISGNISIYGVPYSEHSSFLEMKRFVQWLKPLKIIPTVNNGSWASRKAMEKCFSEWIMEAKAKL